MQTSVLDSLQFVVMQVFNPSKKVTRRMLALAFSIAVLLAAFPHIIRDNCRNAGMRPFFKSVCVCVSVDS
jgi:hypothetical protein